ncbi:hypothetical protein CR513_26485, partial [Mucuna pruriens]
MILRENGDIESESSQEKTSTSRSEDGYLSEEAPYEGDLLMVRRLVSTFIKDDQSQRENIFHLRYMIQDKYRGSGINVSNQRLVDKLCIPIIPHHKPLKLPYKL